LANYISPSWIIVIGDVSLHAYTKAHLAVKASQPHAFLWVQRYDKYAKSPKFFADICTFLVY
ncbi:MAG: hypothetical protein KBT20_03945, partial [Bacteroidales bacterium]|nr:hypothetical protein [Candidatus Liminaster caballi]